MSTKTERFYESDLFTHALFEDSYFDQFLGWFSETPTIFDCSQPFPHMDALRKCIENIYVIERTKRDPLQIPFSSMEHVTPLVLEKFGMYIRPKTNQILDSAHSHITKGIALHILRNACTLIQEVRKDRSVHQVFPTKNTRYLNPYEILIETIQPNLFDTSVYEQAWQFIRLSDEFFQNGTFPLFEDMGLKDPLAVSKYWKSRELKHLGEQLIEHVNDDVWSTIVGYDTTIQYCEVDVTANYGEFKIQIPMTYDRISAHYKHHDEDGVSGLRLGIAQYDDLKTGKQTFTDIVNFMSFTHQTQLMDIGACFVNRLLQHNLLPLSDRPINIYPEISDIEHFGTQKHWIQYSNLTEERHHIARMVATKESRYSFYEYLGLFSDCCFAFEGDVRRQISSDRRKRKRS